MRRGSSHIALLAAVSVALAGCAARGGSAKPSSGPGADQVSSDVAIGKNIDKNATFSWGYTIEATSLDPHRGSSGFDQNWLFPVYDRLVYSAPSGELEPMLATSWEASADGKALTFKLRDGLAFSDGEPFNADAVKFSLDRARSDDSTVKTEMVNVTDVQVLDPLTVKLTLKGGAGSLLGSLADRAGMIVAPDAAQAGTLNTKPVGVGAYKAVEVKPGDHVTYERVEGYWDPAAQNVKTMTFRVMTDDQTRLNALQSGTLSMALIRQNQVQPSLKMGMDVLAGQGPTFYYFGVNTSQPPFDKPEVRKALSMAIDREGIAKGLLEGYCTAQLQPWPETSWAYDKGIGNGLQTQPFDTAKAKNLLKEAGYENGFSFDASTTNITGYTAVAEAVQAQFKEIGVTMNLKVVPSAQAMQEFTIDKTVPATVIGYSPTPDPQGVLDRLLLPSAAANPGKYSDPKIVELSTKAADAVESSERAGYYGQIMQEMLETTPSSVPICMQKRTEAYHDYVTNLHIYASGARDYRGVAIEKH